MRIVTCPKGGKIPEGYCRESCLNYPGEPIKEKWVSLRNLKNLFQSDGRSWLQIYKEDIVMAKKYASC